MVGVTGSIPVAPTIFRKLRGSDVVVMVRLRRPVVVDAARKVNRRRAGAVHQPDRGGAGVAPPDHVIDRMAVIHPAVEIAGAGDMPVRADAAEEGGGRYAARR